MKAVRILAFILFGFLLPALATASQPVGKRPKIPVFDTLGFLPNSMTEEISESLLEARKSDGVDVIVVIIPDFGETSPQSIAKDYADSWTDRNASAIVLYSPGRELGPGPWIYPSGNVVNRLNPAMLTSLLEETRQHIAQEPTDQEKIQAAANASVTLLKNWKKTPVRIPVPQKRTFLESLQKYHINVLHLEIAGLVGIALFIPLLLGFIWLLLLVRRRRPKYFPSSRTYPRLGAPYAGGNYIATHLSSGKH